MLHPEMVTMIIRIIVAAVILTAVIQPCHGRRRKQHLQVADPDLEALRASHEYNLQQTLFHDYDTSVRPRYNSSQTVNVSVRFSLQQIYDLDEKRQVLTISGWLTAEWVDDFLHWNPEEFGGITSVVIDPKKIWTPKLAIGNSADKMFHAWKHFWITVRHSGNCRWQPGGNFAFTCALDMNYYPFDEQTCTMEVETWFYTADKVGLLNSMAEFGLETYIRHGEWAVINTAVTQRDAVYTYYKSEQFPEVYFSIRLRRKYTFYFMYILLPCIMLSFVLLMTFLLPAESGEKVSLGVSILVSFSVFLIIVAEQVPDTSDAVPVIAIYLMYFMMATSLSVMSSTLILKLHYHGLDKEPPRWIRMVIFDVLAPMMCLQGAQKWRHKHRKCVVFECDEDEVIANEQNTANPPSQRNSPKGKAPKSDKSGTNNMRMMNLIAGPLKGQILRDKNKCKLSDQEHIGREWQRVSEVLDRFFFWLFLIFILIPLVSLAGFAKLFST